MSVANLQNLQLRVGLWGLQTFPLSNAATIVTHLRREVRELEDALVADGRVSPEEVADCFLLLLHLAHRGGFDLQAEAERKFQVCLGRKWGAPDAEGVVEHVREEGGR